jgi:hypothetical protein
MGRVSHLFPISVIVLALSLSVPQTSARGDDSVTVQLKVDASEFFGNPLTYQWRATDGNIVDPRSKTTDWILQNGPGIHFAYVLVSNGKGGYTEGRIAVNTDGNPTTTLRPRDQYTTVAQPVPVPGPSQTGMKQIKGTLILDDASVCATINPFFGVNVSAKVQLAANGGNLLGEPVVLDPYAYGQFVIDDNPNGSSLVFTCENATLTVPRSDFNTSFFIIRGTAQPEIKSMSATLTGREIGIFPVPPVVPPGILPSDFLAGRESDKSIGPPSQFLKFSVLGKFAGLDDRKTGCEYYKSVGAVENCDDVGNYIGATLTFDAWRRAAQIDGSSSKEVSAVFVNKTDLNLTRDHHSVQIQNTAAYVCNHSGPAPDPNTDPTGLFPSSFAIDAAIDAVLRVNASHPQGRNLIACVAMDRMPITSVTGQSISGPNDEFVRFLIFGPNGDLLPSVNLDGNGEKFVSGTCVVCHGGSARGTRDRGSYFLPYDVDNFEFHSQHPLTKVDQQAATYMLNLYAKQVNDEIAGTGSDQAKAFDNLFNGWYTHPPMFNSKTWFPPTVYNTSESQSFYLNVVAPSCRTCHVAFNGINWELTDPVKNSLVRNYVCGEALAAYIASAGSMVDPEGSADSYVMPNSMVTFNRFWLSDRPSVVGQPPGISQPQVFMNHYNSLNPLNPALSCHLP